jgi:hypothetical protein
MRTSALLRRQPAELIDRQSSIGYDGARLNAPDGHQIEPATAMLNVYLDHLPKLSMPARDLSDRVEDYQARRRTTSASAKSP